MDKLVANTSLGAHKKTLKKRTCSNGKEVKDIKDTPLPDAKHALKLLKFDSALLMPENQPSVKHDTNYSLDSFLSDIQLQQQLIIHHSFQSVTDCFIFFHLID